MPIFLLEGGASSMELPQDLQWNSSRTCASANVQCGGVPRKQTIFENVSALAPCSWKLGQHHCQPQRVIDAASP